MPRQNSEVASRQHIPTNVTINAWSQSLLLSETVLRHCTSEMRVAKQFEDNHPVLPAREPFQAVTVVGAATRKGVGLLIVRQANMPHLGMHEAVH